MSKQTLQLAHNYQAPDGEKANAPIIFLLHGYGSNEDDLFSFAPELPKTHHIVALKAPLPLQPSGNAWYNIYFEAGDNKFNDVPQAIASRELVVGVIDEAVEKYKANSKDVTLLGFSQGTILSFAIALSYPEKIKNVIGLSGYISEDMLKEGYEKNSFDYLNCYSSHGSADQVIPVQWAQKTKPFLKALGIDCKYSEFPVGHGVAPQNFLELMEWLEKV
ncbi:MAG: phospholipase/carboxylesterase [Patiriisocius sp.]|jgi:phospholipase/carboxylesterase